RRARTRYQPGERIGARSRVSADEHVVLDGESSEHADTLEGARDAERRETMRGTTGHVRAREAGRSAGGRHDAGDEVDERGLPRSIWADETKRPALGSAQVRSIDRGHA